MKIAVEGCAHGELDNIYETLKLLEEKEAFKIDLLICCGDFQASRNESDLLCMAVPQKYCKLCTFYKYYSGEKEAPVLTIFIGGNHEASNYLQELPYGGWVAPNIYYLGYAGVINIGGIRIGGLSGIYKEQDYLKGHFEVCPYSDSSKRSVYHVRNLEVFRLKQLKEPLDIFLSHDWPSGVWNFGNKNQLLKFKPFFEDDMRSGKLGSKPAQDLLEALKPQYYFAAHLHCKFAAVIPHDEPGKVTKFLALDKCLPRKRFLQVLDIPHDDNLKIEIRYDLEWLTVLRNTNHLLSVKHNLNYLPGPGGTERWSFTPTEEEKEITSSLLDDDLLWPKNFKKTAPEFSLDASKNKNELPMALNNPQTIVLCKKLALDDPLNRLINLNDSYKESDDEKCDDTSSFINDTELSINTSLEKRSILNLPKPVNDVVEEENEDICNTDNCPVEVANITKPNDAVKEKGENVNEVDNTTSVSLEADTSDESVKGNNKAKTFKRRNAELYQNE